VGERKVDSPARKIDGKEGSTKTISTIGGKPEKTVNNRFPRTIIGKEKKKKDTGNEKKGRADANTKARYWKRKKEGEHYR